MRIVFEYSKRCLLVFGVAFLLCGNANAQKTSTESQAKPGSRTTTKPRAFCRNNVAVFQKIRLLIEQAKRFQDLEPRTRGVAELSSLLWQCDPFGAETYFQDLHQMLKSEIAKQQPTSKLTQSNSKRSSEEESAQLSLPKLRYLNGYLLSLVYRRNPELAKRLAANDEAVWSEIRYDTVKAFLDNGDTREAAAELRRSIDSGTTYGLASQLVSLRQKDPATADLLFLAYLDQLAHRPLLADEITQAGVYLFVGSTPLPDFPGLLEISYLDHTPVPRFTARLPGVTDNSVRAYLGLVSLLLSQPVEDLPEKKARYVLGRVLLPQVQQSDTGLQLAFQRGLQKLSLEVADTLKNEQLYRSIANSSNDAPVNLDQQLEGIQKISSTDQRDELCAMLANSLYSRKHPAEALKVVKLMSLSETRSQLETTMMSAIAFDLIEHQQPDQAREMIDGIAAGPERSLLFLALAKVLRDGNDAAAAEQLVARAVADARKSDGPKRGLLLIKAAGFLIEQNLLFAEQLYLEGVESLNAAERWRAPSWGAVAIAHGAILRFRFGGADGISFTALIEPLVKKDFEQMEVSISSLKSEQLRFEGFLVLSKHLLAESSLKEKSRTKA